jgi:hypothetical protein
MMGLVDPMVCFGDPNEPCKWNYVVHMKYGSWVGGGMDMRTEGNTSRYTQHSSGVISAQPSQPACMLKQDCELGYCQLKALGQ